MKNIFLFILTATTALAADFFGVYVILSIAKLYSLSFFTQFSFIQIFGLSTLLGILSFKYKKSEGDVEFEEVISVAIKSALTKVFYILVSWGIAFSVFNILN